MRVEADIGTRLPFCDLGKNGMTPRRSTSLSLVSALLAGLPLCAGGCVNVDGITTYVVRGALDDGNGRPIAGVKILAAAPADTYYGSRFNTKQYDANSPCVNSTTLAGEFECNAPVGEFACTYWLGFIPVGPDIFPEAPIAKSIILYIHDGRQWNRHVVALTAAQQTRTAHARRWIELGHIKYSPASQPASATAGGVQ